MFLVIARAHNRKKTLTSNKSFDPKAYISTFFWQILIETRRFIFLTDDINLTAGIK